MRNVMASLLAIASLGAYSWAAGDIGGVKGGSYHSALPVSETLMFGDLKTTIKRTVVQIPEDYGKLVSITPSRGTATLWFQTDQGIIRNVTLSNDSLWAIQRSGNFFSEK